MFYNPSETKKKYKHIYGPVLSRRLGRSLGLDLVPYKTCSYDCLYCQLGLTTDKTVERKKYVSVQDILSELKDILAKGIKADYITLSGSGEPTLHSDLAEIIMAIKKLTKIPVAVLTNGSLLWQKQVRQALLKADLVVPSLDAGSVDSFEQVNRPHQAVSFEQMKDGLIAFRQEYFGKIWLEIFLLVGINDNDKEIAQLVDIVKLIEPDKVQLNTVSRPPAEVICQAVSKEKMEQIARRFTPPAEVIASFPKHRQIESAGSLQDILGMCQRRPGTIEQIARTFNLHPNEVIKYLQKLQEQGLIEQKKIDDQIYWIGKTI
ncbi:MAG: radical SAM protein [Pseudomonadota bacterium]